MQKYPIEANNGQVEYYNYIGVNHDAFGNITDGVISSYHKSFDEMDEVLLENSNNGKRICTIGDIMAAYKLLKNEIAAKGSCNLYQYAECVQKVIINYFGDYSNSKRNKIYSIKGINNEEKRSKVSDLTNSDIPSSIARAMVSQNLLNEIGIDSYFKVSGAIINGKEEIHAYNIIRFDKKNYLFDTTIPSLKDDRISPIICEIPGEVYYWISNPKNNIGYSVHVNQYNPLLHNEVDITYDAGRDFVYDIDRQYTKVIK